jgi:hypothetical protein
MVIRRFFRDFLLLIFTFDCENIGSVRRALSMEKLLETISCGKRESEAISKILS